MEKELVLRLYFLIDLLTSVHILEIWNVCTGLRQFEPNIEFTIHNYGFVDLDLREEFFDFGGRKTTSFEPPLDLAFVILTLKVAQERFIVVLEVPQSARVLKMLELSSCKFDIFDVLIE